MLYIAKSTTNAVARSAQCTDVSVCPLNGPDITMEDTLYLNPILTWIISFWYKQSSEAGVANHVL